MSNLIWDNNGCWYGKVSQPTGIIMCSVEIHCKGLDENAVRIKKIKGEFQRLQVHQPDIRIHIFSNEHMIS